MHRYIFDANTNTKWPEKKCAWKKQQGLQCVFVWAVCAVCAVSSSKNNEHMDIQTHSMPYERVYVAFAFHDVAFYTPPLLPHFRSFTCLNAAAAKAIILAWKFANSHIQSFPFRWQHRWWWWWLCHWYWCVHMCVHGLPLLFMVIFSSTWFLNEVSLLCKSSTQALKINTDTFANTHVWVQVHVPVRS